MASEPASKSKDDLRMRKQQSPLASQRSKDPQNASAPSSLFPLGYKEGFNQWWTGISAAAAEHKVLSVIPYLQQAPTHKQTGTTADSPNGSTDSLQKADHSQAGEETINSVNDPYGPRRWRSSMVELSGKNRALNEFSVERIGEEAEQNLVILHGYGAGLGFFYKNFEPLSRVKGWQLYALDMLGMGRSTRPSFKIKSKNRQAAIEEAEDWFIDALEEWRQKRKIDRFTLLGHSLGGYMATAYALKYPGRLNKLVLVSPVGIPEDPYAISADMPEAGDSALANEFSQDQSTIASAEGDEDMQKITPKGDSNNFLNARSKDSADSSGVPRRRPVPKWLTYLWDANISPFTLVRWSGPLGPRLVSGWTHRRFSHLPAAEAQALHDYSYSIFRLRGSGEYALAYILAPGAFARSPLIRRIHHVGRQLLLPSSDSATGVSTPASAATRSTVSISASENPSVISSPEREKGIPIIFMYGDNDWMDISGGYAAKAKIEEETRRILRDTTAPEERAADNGSAKVITIQNAGHHLYLDGWEEFNQAILDEMADVTRRERRQNG